MSMLDRIKKRQEAGFKELVANIETSGANSRVQIFTTGFLEDPVFMSYVMKNVRSFEDFLQLSTDEINMVLSYNDQLVQILAKCLGEGGIDKYEGLQHIEPRLKSRVNEEFLYLGAVSDLEKEGAKFYLLKVVRSLQKDGKISGFLWKLPPEECYHPKKFPEGLIKIEFENGVIAAEGKILKGKRIGEWRHNYETGNLLAQGNYFEGLKTGEWFFYFNNGKLKTQGKYKDDLRHGQWTEWDSSGAEQHAEYVQGAKK